MSDRPLEIGRELAVVHGPLQRGRRCVLAAGEIRLPAGAVAALVGANGAGKSTLLAVVAGVAPPRVGRASVTLAGAPVRAAWLPQHPSFPPWLVVRDLAPLHGVARDRFEEGLAEAGLGSLRERGVHALSGGERRAIGALLAIESPLPLLLLDEPFAGLDPRRREHQLERIVRRRAERPEGVTLVASHESAELHALCDWLVVLADGGYAFVGTREAFLQRWAPPGLPWASDARRFASGLARLTG